jgi:hypothetical protein
MGVSWGARLSARWLRVDSGAEAGKEAQRGQLYPRALTAASGGVRMRGMTRRKFKRQTPLEAMKKAIRITDAEAVADEKAVQAGTETTVTAMERHYYSWLKLDGRGFMREFTRQTNEHEERVAKIRARKKEAKTVDVGAEKALELIEGFFAKRGAGAA